MAYRLKGLTDFGAYLTDNQYKGIYDGVKLRDPDVDKVMQRAKNWELEKVLILGTSLNSSKRAMKLAKAHDFVWCSVGVQPKRCRKLYNNEPYFHEMLDIYGNKQKKGKIVAVGETGLDFRPKILERTSKKVQYKAFQWHLEMARYHRLPLAMYYRGGFESMMKALKRHDNKDYMLKGMVHSFTGTPVEARAFLRKGFHIGLSGCSIEKKEGLELIKELPVDRLILGTCAPHSPLPVLPPHPAQMLVQTRFLKTDKGKKSCVPEGFVFGRPEPAHVIHILETVASIKKMDPQDLADIIKKNVETVFFTPYEPEVY